MYKYTYIHIYVWRNCLIVETKVSAPHCICQCTVVVSMKITFTDICVWYLFMVPMVVWKKLIGSCHQICKFVIADEKIFCTMYIFHMHWYIIKHWLIWAIWNPSRSATLKKPAFSGLCFTLLKGAVVHI